MRSICFRWCAPPPTSGSATEAEGRAHLGWLLVAQRPWASRSRRKRLCLTLAGSDEGVRWPRRPRRPRPRRPRRRASPCWARTARQDHDAGLRRRPGAADTRPRSRSAAWTWRAICSARAGISAIAAASCLSADADRPRDPRRRRTAARPARGAVDREHGGVRSNGARRPGRGAPLGRRASAGGDGRGVPARAELASVRRAVGLPRPGGVAAPLRSRDAARP